MNWPVNHQVSPAENSVKCAECHTRENGRLANLNDFYIPGRDYSRIVDTIGKWTILLSLLGIAIHGSLRIYAAKKLNNGVKKND